jgi:hypothetical protein
MGRSEWQRGSIGRFAGATLRIADHVLPQSISIRLRHCWRVGRWPNITVPRSFNEKILHRRLYERDPRIPGLIDKASAKNFVRERLGDEWITPSLFEGPELPPRQQRNWPMPYVLKATHGSSLSLFVRSDTEQQWSTIESACRAWTSRQGERWPHTKWPYDVMRRWILAEPFIGDGAPPMDYKFFVFGGVVQLIEVDTDRFSGHKRNFYDLDWNLQPFCLEFPRDPRPIARPASLKDMLEGAEALADGFSFVRVDFYEIAGRPRFGEMTFYPQSGMRRYDPDEYDFKLGALWP